MEKFKKVLLAIGLVVMLLDNGAYATSALVGESDSMKTILLVVAVVLIVAILALSYKADKPTEIKPKKKPEGKDTKGKKDKTGKKDKLKDELVEKDNTYEIEENEVYEDDKIEPVSIAKDEDEISLFESVNNPDTEREDMIIEEEIPNTSSVNVAPSAPVYDANDETVNDFFLGEDEEPVDVMETVEEPVDNNLSNDIFLNGMGMLDMEEEPEEEKVNNDIGGTMVFNSAELNGAIDIFAASEEEEEVVESAPQKVEENEDLYIYNYDDLEDSTEEKVEELAKVVEEKVETVVEPEPKKNSNKAIDIFAPVPEETEFVGFTTLKQKTQSRGGNSRFDKVVIEKEPEVNDDVDENSADDFLAQMERNLETKSAKKTVAKKTAEPKKTAAKKPAAKKTTTTKTKAAKK